MERPIQEDPFYNHVQRLDAARRYLSLGVSKPSVEDLLTSYHSLVANTSPFSQYMSGHVAYDLAIWYESEREYQTMRNYASRAESRLTTALEDPIQRAQATMFQPFSSGIQRLANTGVIAVSAQAANQQNANVLSKIAGETMRSIEDAGNDDAALGLLGEAVVGSLISLHLVENDLPSLLLKSPLREDMPMPNTDKAAKIGRSKRSDFKIIDVPTRANKGNVGEPLPVQVTTMALGRHKTNTKIVRLDTSVAVITRDTLGIDFANDYLSLAAIISKGRRNWTEGEKALISRSTRGILAEIRRARDLRAR